MLSTRQVAERLGVSEASVRRWSDSGHLPVQRVGKRQERRFRARDVDAAARRRPSASPPPKPGAPDVVLAGQAISVPVHVPAFYDSDAGRVRLTAPFLAEGIKAGQPCFLLAQGEELSSYLVALDSDPTIDVDEALSSGALTVAGAPGKTVAQALDFWEAKLWEAMDRHATLMRAVGEMASEREGFESE